MVVCCGLGWAQGQISVNKISLKVWDFFYHLGAFSFSRILVHFPRVRCSFNGFKGGGDQLEHRSYPFHGLDIVRPLEFRHTSFPKLGLFHRLVSREQSALLV